MKTITMEELNKQNFNGWHNVVINNMLESKYDTIEDVLKDCDNYEFTNEQIGLIVRYAKLVFGL